MRGVIVGWVPPSLPPFIKDPPLIIASKCPCPYANRIFEAFRIDFVNKSTLLRSSTKPPIFSIGGRFDQKSFLMRGVIVPPSKLVVKIIFPPKGGFLIRGGFLLRGRLHTSI